MGTFSNLRKPRGSRSSYTTGQRLKDQQDLTHREIAILVLTTTSWPRIQRHAERVVAALEALQPGEYRGVSFLE